MIETHVKNNDCMHTVQYTSGGMLAGRLRITNTYTADNKLHTKKVKNNTYKLNKNHAVDRKA